MTMRSITVGLLIAATAFATTASARHEEGEDPRVTKALAGKVAGEPRSCLSLRDAGRSQTYEGTILYRVNRNLTYRQDMNGCSMLDPDRIQVVQLYSTQLCRGDIATMADRSTGAASGACAFGDFVPYRTVDGQTPLR